MAKIKKNTYTMVTDGGTVQLRLPEYYDDINTQVGLTKIPDDATSTANRITARQLKLSAQAIEFTISRKVGTQTRRTKVIADLDSAKGAVAAIEGKTFGTGLAGGKTEVISVYFASRRRYS